MNLARPLNFLFTPTDAKNFRVVYARNKIVWYASMISKKGSNGRLKIFQRITVIKFLHNEALFKIEKYRGYKQCKIAIERAQKNPLTGVRGYPKIQTNDPLVSSIRNKFYSAKSGFVINSSPVENFK